VLLVLLLQLLMLLVLVLLLLVLLLRLRQSIASHTSTGTIILATVITASYGMHVWHWICVDTSAECLPGSTCY
jgi:hypothetical protein